MLGNSKSKGAEEKSTQLATKTTQNKLERKNWGSLGFQHMPTEGGISLFSTVSLDSLVVFYFKGLSAISNSKRAVMMLRKRLACLMHSSCILSIFTPHQRLVLFVKGHPEVQQSDTSKARWLKCDLALVGSLK